jgi:hypothetical protein
MQLCIVPKHRLVYPLAEKEIMANVSKLIFGAAIVAASPTFAQYAPQSDPSILFITENISEYIISVVKAPLLLSPQFNEAFVQAC